MGIIKKIKQMFAKNIDCAEELNGSLFHYYTKKNKAITVGANIIVPLGYTAILVCRDKITDVLPQGKFAITAATMPNTFSRLGLLRANKKGKLPKNFKADIYFVCVNYVENVKFSSFLKYKTKDRKYGRVSAICEGLFNVVISQPEVILEYLLKERSVIYDELFTELIGGIVGDCVCNKLISSGQSFYDILTLPEMVSNLLNDGEIKKELFSYGFEVDNIKLESMNVKEKLQKRVEQDLRENRQFISEYNQSFESKMEAPYEPIYNRNIQTQMSFNNVQSSQEVGYATCPKCGHKINRGANFCEKCGFNINKIF